MLKHLERSQLVEKQVEIHEGWKHHTFHSTPQSTQGILELQAALPNELKEMMPGQLDPNCNDPTFSLDHFQDFIDQPKIKTKGEQPKKAGKPAMPLKKFQELVDQQPPHHDKLR